MARRNAQPIESRSFELSLPPSRRIVGLIRRALEELDLPDDALDEAQLLASELVTNSIRHAGLSHLDEIRIRAVVTGRTLRVDVFDRSPVELQPFAGTIRPAPGAESGWGLYLVDHIATRWGTAPGRYWFQLDVERRRSEY